ncbi:MULTISPECIES: hypothetical protein [Gracilibacillus]|uniref:hypothetical protein n=1 Tax=Gracilibacillus TaxID=74385 RepID=UPI000825A394|nr:MULTISPECIES: hypothetical protein [Gracilibacillus]
MNEAAYQIIYKGNTSTFETYLLHQAEQELRIGKEGIWCRIADIYTRQLTIISLNPYPDMEIADITDFDESTPSLKHIIKNTEHTNFYRWDLKGGRTGNHRIIYDIHNYHKVILLHYFDKSYNGLIKQRDILPAENNYANYCEYDPNLY